MTTGEIEKDEESGAGEDEPGGETEPGAGEEPKPAYLGDEEPSGKVDNAKYWLLKGKTPEELVTAGANAGTVRIAENALVKAGLLEKRPRKQKPTTKLTAVPETSKTTQVFAKGSPPEAIIETISIPIQDGQVPAFEMGMKFGMSTIVLGVRVAQELSGIGIQQAKPLLDMAKSMREGEAMASKTAADEAAYKAAAAIQSTFGPMMAGIEASIKGNIGSEADPMKAMMVRTMEPLMKGMMGKLVPGMSDQAPTGWTKRAEEKK